MNKLDALIHLAGWYANRCWLRLIYRFKGCNGEGYYRDSNGEIQPCYRKGCH